MPYTPTQRQSLRHHCTLTLHGFKSLSPAEEFKALAAWCEANKVEADVYGEGALINTFECAFRGIVNTCFAAS